MSFAAADPWQTWDNNNRKDPVVPEPGMYGFILTGSLILVFFFRKRKQ